MASDVVREGVFAINKPSGPSSAHIIRQCQEAFNPSAFFRPVIEDALASVHRNSQGKPPRDKLIKRANQLKMGHGGTLDPLASGVLILGVGSGTKVLQSFINCSKSYETTLVFGANTDTYDRAGKIITKRPYDHITRDKVEHALQSFRGDQIQIPPVYSALKMDGMPLYEYARQGKPLPREIQGRKVTALQIEMVEWYDPGQHNHRWPSVEADAAEKTVAEALWKAAKAHESRGSMSPEEKEEDNRARQAHEQMKTKFEERQDALIRDAPQASKKDKRHRKTKVAPMMSGALGDLPQPTYTSKGADLVPDAPDESTPPPWSDEGPPACRIRLSVTSGYYIRSFVHDLGTKLGSAALMSELVRSEQNGFRLDDDRSVLAYEDLQDEKRWQPKVQAMLRRWRDRPAETNGDHHNEPAEREIPSKDETAAAAPKRARSASPSAPAGTKRGRSASPREDPKKKRRDSSAHESEVSWQGIQD